MPPNPKPPATRAPSQYTRTVLIQIFAVLAVLFGIVIWQWELVQQIYLRNQINAIGWTVNGAIVFLFTCGLAVLVWRFLEYHAQENALHRFVDDLSAGRDPLAQAGARCMLAARYRTLLDMHHRRADINQSALAATLLAVESSRNSFPKFVHNILILTGVFGTIISLSLSLLGASDMIQATGAGASENNSGGLGTMIFGMSTALSTTMTAILAYLIFGYFYIKLTDTQTYVISRVEEITATMLLPHLQLNQTPDKDYADSVRSASRLIERFDASQRQYENAVGVLRDAADGLSQKLAAEQVAAAQPADKKSDTIDRDELVAFVTQLGEQQQLAAKKNQALLSEAIKLLREGFRLQK